MNEITLHIWFAMQCEMSSFMIEAANLKSTNENILFTHLVHFLMIDAGGFGWHHHESQPQHRTFGRAGKL
jgi:hypothetical protein